MRVNVVEVAARWWANQDAGFHYLGEGRYLDVDGTSTTANGVNRGKGESWDGKRLEIKMSPIFGMLCRQQGPRPLRFIRKRWGKPHAAGNRPRCTQNSDHTLSFQRGEARLPDCGDDDHGKRGGCW